MHHTTSSYHQSANGMVERPHRQLKEALKSTDVPGDWVDNLPVVLLGIRSAVKEDLGCCAAELCYGTVLRIPGEFYRPVQPSQWADRSNFAEKLNTYMSELVPVQTLLPNGAISLLNQPQTLHHLQTITDTIPTFYPHHPPVSDHDPTL